LKANLSYHQEMKTANVQSSSSEGMAAAHYHQQMAEAYEMLLNRPGREYEVVNENNSILKANRKIMLEIKELLEK
jgi:thymidylate kinase